MNSDEIRDVTAYLNEDCEDCGAGPGQFCQPDCPSGFTAEDARALLEADEERRKRMRENEQ